MNSQAQSNIPGYSGHIPFKNHLVGLTTGAGNRVAAEQYRHTRDNFYNTPKNVSSFARSGTDIGMNKTPMAGPTGMKSNLEKGEAGITVGNMSRYSRTWINGPLHNVRPQ